MALTTLDKIKRYIRLDLTDVSENTFLTDLSNSAKNYIENYCGQPIEAVSKELIFKGESGSYKLLDYFPVNSITSLSYRSEPDDAWTAITSTDYALSQKNDVYRIWYTNGFSESYEYKLVFNTGYSTIPDVIQKIVWEMVAVWYGESREKTLNVSSKTVTDSGYTHTTSYKKKEDEWHRILRKYKIQDIV